MKPWEEVKRLAAETEAEQIAELCANSWVRSFEPFPTHVLIRAVTLLIPLVEDIRDAAAAVDEAQARFESLRTGEPAQTYGYEGDDRDENLEGIVVELLFREEPLPNVVTRHYERNHESWWGSVQEKLTQRRADGRHPRTFIPYLYNQRLPGIKTTWRDFNAH